MYDDGEDTLYGYLYKMVYDDSLEKLYVHIFDEDGDWHKYTVSKLIYNRKSVEPYEMVRSTDAARPALTDMSSNTIRQVIRMVINGDDLIEIEIADEAADKGEFNKSAETLNYRYQNSSFSSKYYICDRTVIFGVPVTDPDNKEAYTISPELEWDQAYNITAYGYDEYGDMDAAEIAVDASDIELNNCVVQGFNVGLNSDGDAVSKIKCSYGVFEDFEIALQSGVSSYGISAGDLVNLTLDRATGRITNINLIYSYLGEGKKSYSPVNLHSKDRLYGTVLKADPENRRIIVNLGTNHPSQSLRLNAEGVIIKKYNTSTKECEATSVFSIVPGDFVVMETESSKITSLLKYEDK